MKMVAELSNSVPSPPPATPSNAITAARPSDEELEVKGSVSDRLYDSWLRHCAALFESTPEDERRVFIGLIEDTVNRVPADAFSLLEKTFSGRKQVWLSELCDYAESKGFPEKLIKKLLKDRGFPRKIAAPGNGARVYYLNRLGTSRGHRLIPDEDFKAPSRRGRR